MEGMFPARFRYPLFFLGLFIMEMAAMLFKYLDLPSQYATGAVVLGFLLFLASVIAP